MPGLPCAPYTSHPMGGWYEIGIAVGLGLGAGILCAGLLAGLRFGLAFATIAAVVVGIGAGLLVQGWPGAVAGIVGAIVGAVSAAVIVRGRAGGRDARRHRNAAHRRRAGCRGARVDSGRGVCGGSDRARSCGPPVTWRAAEVRGPALARKVTKPVILVIIDGLTPAMLEEADRVGGDARACRARRARHLRARRVRVSVAHSRLPLLDRDRSTR